MRIATWNVEYATKSKNERRLRRIREIDCDVWILTETHDDLNLGPSHRAVTTTRRSPGCPGGRWTTIWSRFPVTQELPVEDSNRTVAAILDAPGRPLLVYGTVLPWHTDKGSAERARSWEEQYRVIPAQGREWASLREQHPNVDLCVAGDLNMNLGGPHHYGTRKGREMLRAALDAAGLVCVTETERVPAGKLDHGPIDHVCVSARLASRAKVHDAWEGVDAEGVHMSDHCGIAVEIDAR
jgi:endonuclease/exonuclease/phosphatase family metal-dependent hydrolase